MKKVLGIVVNILTWIVLILALLVTIIVFSSGRNNGVANLMGFIPLTVESNSMYPTFAEGDLIICREIDDLATLQMDDVITFWTIIDGKRVKNTHRIIGINQAENSRSFVTRGDNNSLDDDMPAYEGDIIGKWTNVKISGFGRVMAFLRTKIGFFVCILIPMALFFLFELYKFIVTLIEVKKGEGGEQLDEEEIKRRAIEEYLAQQKAAAGGETQPAAPAEPEKTGEKPAETEKSEEKPAEPAQPAPETVEKVETAAEEKVENAAEPPAASEETPAESDNPEQTENVENSVETVENSVEAVESPVETAETGGQESEQESKES